MKDIKAAIARINEVKSERENERKNDYAQMLETLKIQIWIQKKAVKYA